MEFLRCLILIHHDKPLSRLRIIVGPIKLQIYQQTSANLVKSGKYNVSDLRNTA